MEFDRLVVGFLVDEVVGGFFISVPPGHIACIYDRGRGVLPKVWGPGLHLKFPFWQIAKMFNAQILEYAIKEGFDFKQKEILGDDAITTSTSDGFAIQIEGSLLLRIKKQSAPAIWENIGENFVSKVVRPIARSKISSKFSQVKLHEIKATRSLIEEGLKEELNREFNDKGLICEGVLLSEVKEQNKINTRETQIYSGHKTS